MKVLTDRPQDKKGSIAKSRVHNVDLTPYGSRPHYAYVDTVKFYMGAPWDGHIEVTFNKECKSLNIRGSHELNGLGITTPATSNSINVKINMDIPE